jgi:hypothetical protein
MTLVFTDTIRSLVLTCKLQPTSVYAPVFLARKASCYVIFAGETRSHCCAKLPLLRKQAQVLRASERAHLFACAQQAVSRRPQDSQGMVARVFLSSYGEHDASAAVPSFTMPATRSVLATSEFCSQGVCVCGPDKLSYSSLSCWGGKFRPL